MNNKPGKLIDICMRKEDFNHHCTKLKIVSKDNSHIHIIHPENRTKKYLSLKLRSMIKPLSAEEVLRLLDCDVCFINGEDETFIYFEAMSNFNFIDYWCYTTKFEYAQTVKFTNGKRKTIVDLLLLTPDKNHKI